MTAKRFRFNGMSNCIEYDNESILLDSYGEDIAELLNVLHEENQILQSRNKRLEKKIQRERTSFRKTHGRWSKESEDKIKELSEENERLRRCINTIYTIARLEEV